jgi:hypothetical protein
MPGYRFFACYLPGRGRGRSAGLIGGDSVGSKDGWRRAAVACSKA